MNEHETERIAAAIHQLRPDWPAASLRTFITKNLADRPRRDVAVALAWIACEPGTAKPARVLGAGPWWHAAAVEGWSNHYRDPWDRGEVCSVCSKTRDRCESGNRNILDDHTFVSIAEQAARVKADDFDTDAIRVALRSEITPTRETPEKQRPSTPNPHAEQARASLTQEEA